MARLLFFREVPQIEKKAGTEIQLRAGVIALVGLLTLSFVVAAIVLYSLKQPEAGRLVIDIAVAFLAWSTGRVVGEKAGLARR